MINVVVTQIREFWRSGYNDRVDDINKFLKTNASLISNVEVKCIHPGSSDYYLVQFNVESRHLDLIK